MSAWLWLAPLAAAGAGLHFAALASSAGRLGRGRRRGFDSGPAGMTFRLPCGHAREVGPRTNWLRALREGCEECRPQEAER